MCTAHDAELRPVTSWQDALAMAEVRNECRTFMTRNTDKIGALQQLRWWRKVKNDPTWFLYLLWYNGNPVGYGIIRVEKHMHWVTGGIRESSRGHGFCRLLFRQLTEQSTDGSCAYLEVREDNRRAINLYRSLGYRYIGNASKNVIVMRADPA